MKRKITTILLAFCVSISVVSCSNNENVTTNTVNKNDNIEDILPKNDTNVNTNEPDLTTQENIENIKPISKDLNLLSIDGVNGKIHEMWIGHDNEIVLLADKLHIFDVTKQSLVATSDTNYPELVDTSVRKLLSGYALVGYARQSSNNSNASMSTVSMEQSGISLELICYIYDENLNKINEISIPNCFTSTTNITVTPDGKDIIYFNNSKITKLNISSGTTSVIKDLSNTDVGELVSTNYISVSDDGKQILFTGQTMTNTESVPSYGVMNIDGSDVINKQYSGYIVGDGAVIGGNILVLPEDSRVLSGRLLLLNIETLEEKLINLSSIKESNGRTVVSSNGKYFANGEIKSNEYIVRIYETDTGELINTTSIKDDEEGYFYRGSRIAINEDSRVCTVALGYWHTEIDTKMYTWGF